MIQRIQSLYLLLTSLLSLLFLQGTFLKFFNNSGSEIIMNFHGIWQSEGAGNASLIRSNVPLSVIIILISALSLAAISLYKKRILQLKLSIAIIFLTIISIALMTFNAFWIIAKYQAVLVPGIRMFVPLLILVFCILASRGIKKDENLVKSYDRLR